MFGDIGHGFMLFLVGCLLCFLAEPLSKTSLRPIVMARYLITMMGFFATYCGICYNDFMSIPIEGGTCYTWWEVKEEGVIHTYGDLTPDCIYSIGVDPIWYQSTNELTYMNTLKMKTSVIFGVAQMSLGIFMKAANSLYFKRYVDFYFEFLP